MELDFLLCVRCPRSIHLRIQEADACRASFLTKIACCCRPWMGAHAAHPCFPSLPAAIPSSISMLGGSRFLATKMTTARRRKKGMAINTIDYTTP